MIPQNNHSTYNIYKIPIPILGYIVMSIVNIYLQNQKTVPTTNKRILNKI